MLKLHQSLVVGLILVHYSAQFSTNTSGHHCCASIKVSQGKQLLDCNHFSLQVQIECSNCHGYDLWGIYDQSNDGDSCPSDYYRYTIHISLNPTISFNLNCRAQNPMVTSAPQFLYQQTDESWHIVTITCPGLAWLRYQQENLIFSFFSGV